MVARAWAAVSLPAAAALGIDGRVAIGGGADVTAVAAAALPADVLTLDHPLDTSRGVAGMVASAWAGVGLPAEAVESALDLVKKSFELWEP